MPLFLVATLVLLLTMGSSLLGMAVGRRLRPQLNDIERAQLYGMQASLLGLLALLLGFSFAMAESRFELRKQLVIDEGNAVGTARLRTAAVADPRGQEIRRLLEAYVDTRIEAYLARDERLLHAGIAESARLQRQIWAQASALVRDEPRSLPAALLLQALNEVIDLDAKRLAAGRNHVPATVLIMLLVVAAVAMGWVGAGVGLGRRRGVATTLLLSLSISMVVGVIVDLDQPRRGLIRVSQATLIDLQRSFRYELRPAE